ncbi:SMI1/KNR4 family protein [Halobaculum sp. MBLA0147]|uniref:SMI1/KNR4 family protein n=1 Tax=Halobaculum sp. MBLA0147 TaxID=3079934 RepID=UPI003525CA39
MRPIHESWQIVEDWLEAHDAADVLSPPPSDEDVAAIAETVGVDLPDPFETFLRRHDGQTPGSRPLFRRHALCSAESIVDNYTQMTTALAEGTFEGRLDGFEDWAGSPDPEVAEVWWNDIPFAHDASGNFLCLDLDPTPEGDYGQVITVWHDMPGRYVRGEGFTAWFDGYATALEEGTLRYSEHTHGLVAEPPDIWRHEATEVSDPTSADLRRVYDAHYDRRGGEYDDNWFAEVCLDWQGSVDPCVQFQWGTLNVAGLPDRSHVDAAKTVLFEEDLPVHEESEMFVTTVDPSLDADRAAAVTERVLREVYDTELEDVETVRERVL